MRRQQVVFRVEDCVFRKLVCFVGLIRLYRRLWVAARVVGKGLRFAGSRLQMLVWVCGFEGLYARGFLELGHLSWNVFQTLT